MDKFHIIGGDMLDNKGFDLWANGYDKSVQLSEESNTYPFAGYRSVLSNIYKKIKVEKTAKILDIGFGTAVLSKKLYDENYQIWGIDFSEKMIEIAKSKMPTAKLIQCDFANGLPQELESEKFDYIVCTYAIHHLKDNAKIQFISDLLEHITPEGKIFIGDVAFETRAQLEKCRKSNQDDWDFDEFYPVLETFKNRFSNVIFDKLSFCSGVITFGK